MPRCRPSSAAACRPSDSVTRDFERACLAIERPIKQLARKRRHDPDDLYAEVGLRAWEALCRPDAVIPTSWPARLIRIAHNVLADEGRRQQTDARAAGVPAAQDGDSPATVVSLDALAILGDTVQTSPLYRGAALTSADPHDVLVAQDEHHTFYAALDALPRRDRRVLEDWMDGKLVRATARRQRTTASSVIHRRPRAARRLASAIDCLSSDS